ncbi:MAG: hypothetical protein ACYCW5_06650, partial [Thermoleophilia bacterium]
QSLKTWSMFKAAAGPSLDLASAAWRNTFSFLFILLNTSFMPRIWAFGIMGVALMGLSPAA